jgi:transposase-like protein
MKPITPAEREKMVKLYREGLTISAVAARMGRSYAGAYHALDEAGVLRSWSRKCRGRVANAS